MIRRLAPLLAAATVAMVALTGCGESSEASDGSERAGYAQKNLVANWEAYKPQIVEPELKNAWGISLRPAGAGGHWWITAQGSGKSFEYVGDVPGKPLYQDDLKVVDVPNAGGKEGTPTGTVFNEHGKGFVIEQDHPNGMIKAPAKFLFCTDEGVVTAWTERETGPKKFDRPADSKIVYDRSKQGGAFFGIAISPANDRLYLADFGETPGVTVLDEKFKPLRDGGFDNPFGKKYAPFNVQTIGDSVFVAYAEWGGAGEEEPAPGAGRLAEFTPEGKLVGKFDGGKYLNAPWGIAKAPAKGFGPHNGQLLAANFGDGTIAVLDPKTRKATDFLRRPDGHRVEIDGIWGLAFGNGQSLGRADALYFAAGPGPEEDGIFGRLSYSTDG